MNDLQKIELIAAFNKKDVPRIRALLAGEFTSVSHLQKLDFAISFGFLTAAYQGWLDIIQLMYNKNPAYLEVEKRGETALIFSAMKGHADVAAFLLSCGANPNAVSKNDKKSYYGYTALHWAAYYGHCDAIKVLMGKLSPHMQVPGSQSLPIHLAALMGHEEAVSIFLDKDITFLEAADADNQTPLVIASRYGHLNVVRNLLQRKANLAIATPTAFTWACVGGYLQVYRELCRAGGSPTFKELVNLFHRAAEYGQLCIVEELLEANPALLDEVDQTNQTALICAASQGHLPVVTYLLSKKANLKIATNKPGHEKHGYTALQWAAISGFTEVVDVLLKAGAQDEPIGEQQFYLIHLAARRHRVDLIHLLLERNPALINREDGLGYTALTWAAELGHTDVVEELVRQPQVSLNVKTKQQKTPLILAKEKGHYQIVNILIYHLFKEPRYIRLQDHFLTYILYPEQAMDFLLLDPENRFILSDPRIAGLIKQFKVDRSDTVIDFYQHRRARRNSFFAQVDLKVGSFVIYRPQEKIGEGRENTVRIFTNQTDQNDKVVVKAPKQDSIEVNGEDIRYFMERNDSEAKLIQMVYPEVKINKSLSFCSQISENRYSYKHRLVTQYFDGETARTYLPKVDNVNELAKIIILMLEALMKLHAKGIIHSDIKLDNILILNNGGQLQVIFIDFGMARLVVEPSRTPPVYAHGYAEYCAPELECNKRIYPHPNQDIFSLAYTLFTEVILLHALAYELVVAYPIILDFIHKSLNADPLKRDQSLESFYEDLLISYQHKMEPAITCVQ